MNKSKLLLIAAIAFAAVSCGNDKTSGNTPAANDSTTVANEAFEPSINIRYVSMDSITQNYVLAQNIANRAQQLAENLQSYSAQLENQLQSHANQIQQKAQSNGYLSQASYEADVKELEQKRYNYQSQISKRDQEAGQEIDRLQKELRDSIENFMNAYNKEKKYDAILYRDAGIYFNPALDITKEIVDGLNARYKGAATTETATPTK